MKIFLNEKTVELLEFEPVKAFPGKTMVHYRSPEELKKTFAAFEKEDSQMNLVIWSKNNGDGLIRDFSKLFKRIDAAGGLVKNEKGQLLFIFRSGKWDLPKGKLSEKETPKEAAIREVKEETGLRKLTIGKKLPSTWHIYFRKGKQILKQTWWFGMEAASEEKLIPETKEDITEVRWVDPSGIQEILTNTYGSIRELVASLPHPPAPFPKPGKG